MQVSKPVLFAAITLSSMASVSSLTNKLLSSEQPSRRMRVLKEGSGPSKDAAQKSMGIGLQPIRVVVVRCN
nr:hypothetical protein CFP56_52672 [Quercus suber]